MTAADLIALLRSHPKACGALGIIARTPWGDKHWVDCQSRLMDLHTKDHGAPLLAFAEWLTGAATLKADEMGIDINETRHGWIVTTGHESEQRTLTKLLPTRLHATLAAIEAAITEETKT